MIGSDTLVPEAPTGSGTVVSEPVLADAEAMFTPSSRKERYMRSYAWSLRSGSVISMRALSGVGGLVRALSGVGGLALRAQAARTRIETREMENRIVAPAFVHRGLEGGAPAA